MGMKRLTIPACIIMCVIQLAFITTLFSQNKEIAFRKHTLTTDFIAEGVAVGDVDKDGKADVLAGTHWFKNPRWQKNNIAEAKKFKTTEYSQSFLHFAEDVNRDGSIDLIKIAFPGEAATWLENPGKAKQLWKEHLVYRSVGNESPAMYDIDGDGNLDLLCNNSKEKKVVWVSQPKKGDTTWNEYVISSDTLRGTHQYTHGLGFGDVNLDGRSDVVYREGWWEAPEDRKQSDWTFHPANLGDDCAQMYVRDFDGDGDSDVLSSSAHNYGIWWYEQVKQGDSTSWIKHEIFKDFSQSHGLMMADIDGDGDEDFVTGKRYYAHNGHDPGANDPAVIYWFEYRPGNTPSWTPHKIDDNSGAGLNLVVADINGDQLKDIVVSNKKGVYVFEQIRK